MTASRRARIFKRIVVTTLVLTNLLVGFVYWRIVSVEAEIRESATQDSDVVAELDPVEASEPVTFLLVGSDSRAGLDDLENFGDAPGQRSDVMILLRLYPRTGTAAMLSLPRDLWVSIPGEGENRLNAAYAIGGSPLLVATIKSAFGVEINRYVEVDFVGFQAIVDELGGVYIDFPYSARDPNSGLDVQAGRQLLGGDQALAYARSRHYQENRDGTWVSVDADDFGRTRRQQNLIFAIISAAKRPSSIAEAGSIAGSFAQHLTLDSELAGSSLIRLGYDMRGVVGSNIDAATLPGNIADVGGMSVVLRDEPEATNMLRRFELGEPLLAQSSQPLRLEVLNGNGIEGSAGAAADAFTARGFDVVRVGDAQNKDFTTTFIIVRPADVARAQTLVDSLGFGEVQGGTVPDDVDAVVIVGTDAINLG